MVLAERKELGEILAMLRGYSRPLIVGCATCVTACHAGGAKEVAALASALRLATSGEPVPLEVDEVTVARQCEWELIDGLEPRIAKCDAIVSMGCGAGAQTLAARFERLRVIPALNTKFIAGSEHRGVWARMCAACGDCVLDRTAGVCPIARCAKSLLNGPCGGSQGGRCEVGHDVPCAWSLIHDRLSALGRLDLLEEPLGPKDWSHGRDAGQRSAGQRARGSCHEDA